ncbi:hypothetical protein [Niabella drilacis]|uniref:Uncharacterized protein n=1 Tax=Niabella drilacis (strain DSM 25811 / CCM 8410 / CCUG 62505 / LMG 26954 / E90) TaxID=1285928 RepID=A0A1G6UR36_NIADE|nr:hypothetical protein [Niabella drilacis]SDD43761.1 hypothetical protein SAMN04487894_10963 [Niabella drilacis]
MKLTDLIKDIENIDEEAIIFQEDRENPNSDIILSFAEEGDEGVKEVEGRKYYYLIEVFLAKEFVEDWAASLGHEPTLEEKVKRLYDYAINDA